MTPSSEEVTNKDFEVSPSFFRCYGDRRTVEERQVKGLVIERLPRGLPRSK